MTNLVGTIKDSGGNGITGRLDVALVYSVLDTSTTPDSLYTTRGVSFDIEDGEVDITLLESQTYSTPYNFKFYRQTSADPLEYDPIAVLDFNAIVPNVGTFEFSSLLPTGISNANLDTSALRVADLITSDAALVTKIRPSKSFVGFISDLSETRKFVHPKPVSGGILVQKLSLVLTAGYADWTFGLGRINSLGVDAALTPTSTPQDAEINGRYYITQLYNSSQPDTVLGLYLDVQKNAASSSLFGSYVIEYTETA
jgi:hypothetical protein